MPKYNMVEEITNKIRCDVFVDITEAVQLMDDLELRDRDGRTLLINAACYNCLTLVETLLRQGADVNASDKIGNTALHAAVLQGGFDVIRTLLENGANVNQKNIYGNTPLWLAEPTRPKEIFSILLSFGADPKMKNNFDVSAFDRMSAYPEIIELYQGRTRNT